MEIMEMGLRRRKGQSFGKKKNAAGGQKEGRARGNDERGHVLGKGLTGGALGIKKGSQGWVAFEFLMTDVPLGVWWYLLIRCGWRF